MKKLIKSKLFIAAFLLTYFSFFVVTVSMLEIKSRGFGEGHWAYGFPFTYYYSHCFGGYYLWSGLIGNVLFAAFLGFASGLVFVYFWQNSILPFWQVISSSENRKKWYL